MSWRFRPPDWSLCLYLPGARPEACFGADECAQPQAKIAVEMAVATIFDIKEG